MFLQANVAAARFGALAERSPALRRVPVRDGALLIAGLALLVYLRALDGQFILDDDIYLTSSRLVAAPDGWYRFWLTSQPIDYYPVSNTTLWIEWRLWGTNSTGYHVTNLLLHIVSGLLIWAVLTKLGIPGALLAALLFTVHPVNVESVAWISQRKDLLALLFFLLSILWYADDTKSRGASTERRGTSEKENPRRGARGARALIRSLGAWYWVSLLAFLVAMLSKGSAAALPVVLLLIVWWQRRQIGRAIAQFPDRG